MIQQYETLIYLKEQLQSYNRGMVYTGATLVLATMRLTLTLPA